MPTSTVENYIKQIYLLQTPEPAAILGSVESPALTSATPTLVAMGELATALRVVPGTATSMIKTLAEAGLVEYEPRAGVRLTPEGERLALHVLRRHRLIELFLVRTLGMDWSEIHDEAEQLEHVISDRVLERIDAHLGHPTVDPHGDIIPDAAGALPERALLALSELAVGRPATVGRIADQADAFLQFIDQSDLRPGRTLEVESRDEHAAVLHVRLDTGRRLSLGLSAAAKIEVES